MNIVKCMIRFSDSKNNERKAEVGLPENYNDEDVAKHLWSRISQETDERLLPSTEIGSTTPWQNQLHGFGYKILECTRTL